MGETKSRRMTGFQRLRSRGEENTSSVFSLAPRRLWNPVILLDFCFLNNLKVAPGFGAGPRSLWVGMGVLAWAFFMFRIFWDSVGLTYDMLVEDGR